MPIHDLNHVNIKANRELLARVRDFYVDIIGLREGWRPDVPVPGFWLYAGDKPVLHLMEAADSGEMAAPTGEPGHVDHIAFTCTGVDAFSKHLETCRTPYCRRDFPEFDTVQLVVKDPTGMDVELNFSS
jgi:catechol 2,3-dioxygenase-like lactoylglutathione lyase family enzyme